MLEVTGIGETRWHWKTRSIYRNNRFDNLAWHKGVDYHYKLARDNPRKDVQAVFVSGVLKPPATNRGVSPRKANEILCSNCNEPTGLYQPALIRQSALCEDCWIDIDYSDRSNL